MRFIAKEDNLILNTAKGHVEFVRGELDTKDQVIIAAIKETPAFKDGGIVGVTEKELGNASK